MASSPDSGGGRGGGLQGCGDIADNWRFNIEINIVNAQPCLLTRPVIDPLLLVVN